MIHRPTLAIDNINCINITFKIEYLFQSDIKTFVRYPCKMLPKETLSKVISFVLKSCMY